MVDLFDVLEQLISVKDAVFPLDIDSMCRRGDVRMSSDTFLCLSRRKRVDRGTIRSLV